MSEKISSNNQITWCPGCRNFLIKTAVEKAVSELINEGMKKKDFVSVTGIGCADKIYDYLNLSGINSLHGRTLPVSLGVKISNPNLKVLGFSGDGGAYNEGMGHLIHACRDNSDINFIVHNNKIFGLTVGEATSTTEQGFKEKTTPTGVLEKPINPIALVLDSGAGFVARLNCFDIKKNVKILKKAIKHNGFSFIEFLQPCIQFHDFSEYIKKDCYYIKSSSYEEALKNARKWDYSKKGKIPVGIFYENKDKSFEDKRDTLKKLKKKGKGFYSRNQKNKVLF